MKSLYKKLLAYVIVIALGLVMMRGIRLNELEGSKKFIQAFATTSFQVEATELNIWGEYMPKYMEKQEMERVVKDFASYLGITDGHEALEEKNDKRIYTLTKKAGDATTQIQLVETIKNIEADTYQAKNYLMVNIVLHHKYQSITYFEEKINDYFKKLKIQTTSGLTVTATKNGEISEVTAEGVMTQLVNALGGEVKAVFLEDELKSVYGYTKYFDNYITASGKKINMDLTVTYNEKEDRTYLYGAIPIITFEY
ncbi:MAG: YwmB family TATA-box binding protein [Vallitaleaceae bacterium]|nr:YwmB family TATA-box binding protein [Vallitaleaceae bacterium]